MIAIVVGFNLVLALLCFLLTLGLLKLYGVLQAWGTALARLEQRLSPELIALQSTLHHQANALEQAHCQLARLQQQWRLLQQGLTLLSLMQAVWGLGLRPMKRGSQTR